MDLNSNRGFIPNFCDVKAVFMLVLLVELLALLLALVPTRDEGFWGRLALISLFAQWLGLINASLLCGLKSWLNKQTVIVCAGISFGLMIIIALAFSGGVVYFGGTLGLVYYAESKDAWVFVLRVLAISAIIFIVVLRYFYVQHQWRSNIEAQSHAQVQALKARIRPHFLFNSMNTIASLVHINAEKAEKAVEDLSDLFRSSLKEDTSHSLQDELDLVKSYLDIEHLRLEDRLHVEWRLDGQTEKGAPDIEVPVLCMQPLVENAIYYGIEPVTEGGDIKISAQLHNNRLCLSVSNPIGEQNNMSRHKGNHMAQSNIKTRLSLMYGKDAEFLINAEPQLYTVSIGIPI